METRGIPRNRVTVRRGQVQQNGDSVVNFTFTNSIGKNKNGICNISPSGQVTHFEIEDAKDRGRASFNQALDACPDEVARTMGVDRQNVRVQHGLDPGNGSSLVNYQVQDRSQRIRTGSCRVSPYGEIETIR